MESSSFLLPASASWGSQAVSQWLNMTQPAIPLYLGFGILSQRCGSKNPKSIHSTDTCSHLQKAHNAVTVFLCWSAVSNRNFSLEDSLPSLFPKLNTPGWIMFFKIPLQPPLQLNSRSNPRITISSHSRLLRLPWKEKAVHQKKPTFLLSLYGIKCVLVMPFKKIRSLCC